VSHWTDARFGTDPEGDARRRLELNGARLDPEVLDRLRVSRLDEPDDLAGAIRRTAHLVPPSPVEVVEDLDPHAITRTEYPWGVAWACACGGWEAVATGPSSAAWAERDHARHVRDRLDAEPGS
jgi:hypothetical protein